MADESKSGYDIFKLPGINDKGFGKKPSYSLRLPEFSLDESVGSKGVDNVRSAIIRINLDQLPAFKKLNVLQAFGARLALTAIQLGVNMGHIDTSRLSRIADFGAGGGGPTFALVEVAKASGGQVTAIENNRKSAAEIVDSGILPQEQVRIEDGIRHLEKAREIEGEGYDLVTSFMLGPDISGKLFRDLAHASARGLNEGGNLLVTSDAGTFAAAKEICEKSGVQYKFIHGVSEGDKIVVPHTLIIAKESCAGIQ